MSAQPVFGFVLTVILSSAAVLQQAPEAARYQISGTVVDHLTNRPIARALVRLTPITGPGQLTSLTGEDGRFQFLNVPRGKYRLAAQRRGQTVQALHETDEYSTAIVAGPGAESTNIVFPLRVPASISGVVLDEEDDPVQSASVLLFRERVLEGEKRTMQYGQNNTNSLGQFRFGQLASGTYYLAVQARIWPGFGESMGQHGTREGAGPDVTYPTIYYGDTSDVQAASPIVLTEGAAAQVQVTVHPVPNIHVQIPNSRPNLPNRSARLYVRGPGGVRIAVPVFFFSWEGHFEMTGFPAGRYIAENTSASKGVPEGVATQEVELADGVELAAQEPSSKISLSGHVTVEGGEHPARQLRFMMAEGTSPNGMPLQVASDGSIGSSRPVIFPGLYSIRIFGPDFYIKSIAVKGARQIGDRIELVEGSSAMLSIVAAPTGNLSKLDGFAVRDGKPVPAAMVLLVPSDVTRTTLFRRDQSDSDGSFAMTAIDPGRYTLVGIDDDGRGLAYKDPAVIQPYLANGQILDFPLRSTEPVKIRVQARLR